jgi:hypothetical protein
MEVKFNVGDKVYHIEKDYIVDIIRNKIFKKEIIDIQKLFVEIATYFVVEIIIRKNSVSYSVNTTGDGNYFTDMSYDENELFADVETVKNIIKEILIKELNEYQEIVNKNLENYNE